MGMLGRNDSADCQWECQASEFAVACKDFETRFWGETGGFGTGGKRGNGGRDPSPAETPPWDVRRTVFVARLISHRRSHVISLSPEERYRFHDPSRISRIHPAPNRAAPASARLRQPWRIVGPSIPVAPRLRFSEREPDDATDQKSEIDIRLEADDERVRNRPGAAGSRDELKVRHEPEPFRDVDAVVQFE